MSGSGLIIALFAAIAVGLLFWLPLLRTRKARGKPIPASAGLPETGRLLIYFYSHHCGNCRAITPLVDGLDGQDGQGQTVFKFDTAESHELAAELGIRVVPTVALVEDGTVVTILAGDQTRRVSRLTDADWQPVSA